MKEVVAIDAQILKWTSRLLTITVWVSAALFGLYILAFYASALYRGNMEQWNEVLPGLYERNSLAATSGIGLHFAAGGIILLLGSIQLIEPVRVRFPAFHRWVGRVYLLASLFAGLGGLVFIFLKGTIGGIVMDIGFGLYGILMLVAAIQTYRHAVARNLDKHRAWALRLYALAIGSFLYRMDYGFWIMLTDAWGKSDVDMAARMLREAQVDARRLVDATEAALAEDGHALLTHDEFVAIQSAMYALADELESGSDLPRLKRISEALNAATTHFAGLRMDAGIRRALSGTRITDLQT